MHETPLPFPRCAEKEEGPVGVRPLKAPSGKDQRFFVSFVLFVFS